MKKFKYLISHLLRLVIRIPLALKLVDYIVQDYELAIKDQAERKVLRKISSNGHFKVLYGPFKGLTYPSSKSVGSVWVPKILGTYESELHHILETICNRQYATIIDIGAGEGYYAVGLAKRIPDAEVFAFEANPDGRELLREMARLNHVGERIIVSGVCDIDQLSQLLREKKGLIFCDCEGCELELLQPDKLPNLKHFDLLVELHDYSRAGPTVSQIFYSRFSETHSVEVINMKYENPCDHLKLETLSPAEWRAIVSEKRRFSVGWVFLESKGL